MKNGVQKKLFPEDEKQDAQPHEGVGKPPEQMLLDFVSESGEANRESLLEAAAALKIPPSEVDGILERLRLEGFVYCPRHGVFKVV